MIRSFLFLFCMLCFHNSYASTVAWQNYFKCQTACGLAVNELQRDCHWCCEENGFYQRCVKTFEEVLKHIKAPAIRCGIDG